MKAHQRLTIVIKLGSSSIINEHTHQPILSVLSSIVETAVKLRKDGHRVVIVSSGAIAMGLRRMGIEKKPKSLAKKQALASIGQCQLTALWDGLFQHLQQPSSQVLLTRSEFADRNKYLMAQDTFTELFNFGAIPIVNENDTVAVAEIKFGDNDTLSAITAAIVQADYLFLMTDVDCLYDKNPRTNADAQPVEVVEDISSLVADVSSAGSSLGTGGMSTKIGAARLATAVGVTTVITRSSKPENIFEIVQHAQASKPALGDSISLALEAMDRPPLSNSISSLHIETPSRVPLHTRFLPDPKPIRDRSFWLLYGLAARGTVYIDEGAHRALASKAGLLPAGIVAVEGTFSQQEAVRLCVVADKKTPVDLTLAASDGKVEDENPRLASQEVGRALVNYSSVEIARIKGLQSTEIQSVLGYNESDYVALRGNVSLEKRDRSRPATPGPGP